jgi:hypothetical protein
VKGAGCEVGALRLPKEVRVKLDWRDRRIWVGTIMLVLIALPLGVAYYGSRSGPPAPAPTPYPPPTVEGLWRIEGSVMDEANKPIEGVCLVIGPLDCRATSPKSDKSGKYYFDLPVANVDYDLHFIKIGYQQLDVRIHPIAPSTFSYVLKKG